MTARGLLLTLVLALPAGAADPPPLLSPPTKPGKSGATPCAQCHNTTSFVQAHFPHHARTVCPLREAHQKVGCKECHRGAGGEKYRAPLQRTCEGCHRDPHVGSLGLRCEGCHDETSWRSRFDAE